MLSDMHKVIDTVTWCNVVSSDDGSLPALSQRVVAQNKLVRERPEVWRNGLRQLVPQAQQQRDDRMLRNPYLQMSAMLDAGLPDIAF